MADDASGGAGSGRPDPPSRKKKKRGYNPPNKQAAERGTYPSRPAPPKRRGPSQSEILRRKALERKLREADRRMKPTPIPPKGTLAGDFRRHVDALKPPPPDDATDRLRKKLTPEDKRMTPTQTALGSLRGTGNVAEDEDPYGAGIGSRAGSDEDRETRGEKAERDRINRQKYENALNKRGKALEDYYRKNYAWVKQPDGTQRFVRTTPGPYQGDPRDTVPWRIDKDGQGWVWDAGSHKWVEGDVTEAMKAGSSENDPMFSGQKEQGGYVFDGKDGGIVSYRHTEDAAKDIFRMSPEEVADKQRKMGLPVTGYPDARTIQYWEYIVKTSASYTSVGKNLSPDQVLQMWYERDGGGGGYGYGGGYGGGGGGGGAQATASEIKKFANSVAEEELGREITGAELKALAPLVRSALASGGDPEQVIIDWIRANKGGEAGAYASIDYFNAAMNSLGALNQAGAEAEQ